MKRALLLALLPLSAFAWEKTVRRADVPAAVLRTARQLYPGARETGYDMDPGQECKLAYGVHLRVDKRHIEVNIFPNGDVRDVEETLDEEEYPREIVEAFGHTAYGTFRLERVNRITFEGVKPRVEYELLVSQGMRREKTLELRFDASGKLLGEYWLNPPQKDDGCKV